MPRFLRTLLALVLLLAGLLLAAAGAGTVYFRDPLKTTLVLAGVGAVLLGAAGWLFRRR
ncbi:MAG: LPXTG cell wall anchor domain-containing protein [Gemmatimonadetes bacterium]|nr:LPXTG cell wall anchor domain-containing protein [Gemmatimonadota bacterium]